MGGWLQGTKQVGDLAVTVDRAVGRRTAMIIALWIIAVCEIVRAVQNAIQLRMVRHDTSARDNAYAEFIKSLKSTDKEFVRQMLEEFERQEGEQRERTTNRSSIP